MWRLVSLYISLLNPRRSGCPAHPGHYCHYYYDDFQAVCEKWFSVLWLTANTVTVKTSAAFSVCPPTSERGGNGSNSAGSCCFFFTPKPLPVGKEVHYVACRSCSCLVRVWREKGRISDRAVAHLPAEWCFENDYYGYSSIQDCVLNCPFTKRAIKLATNVRKKKNFYFSYD